MSGIIAAANETDALNKSRRRPLATPEVVTLTSNLEVVSFSPADFASGH